MKCNIGKEERIGRAIIGAVGVGYGTYMGINGEFDYINTLSAILGGVLLITSVFGFCPPYALLGISTTCSLDDKKK